MVQKTLYNLILPYFSCSFPCQSSSFIQLTSTPAQHSNTNEASAIIARGPGEACPPCPTWELWLALADLPELCLHKDQMALKETRGENARAQVNPRHFSMKTVPTLTVPKTCSARKGKRRCGGAQRGTVFPRTTRHCPEVSPQVS